MKSTLSIATAAFFLTACGDMGKEPSTLQTPQILAAHANPRLVDYGSTVTLEAVTHGVDSLEWYACFAPYIPDGDPRCATEPDFAEIELGQGATVELTIPSEDAVSAFGVELPAVYIRLVASGDDREQIAIATIPLGQAQAHPAITAFTDDEGNSPPSDIAAGSELVLIPELVLDTTDDVLVTWFIEGGEASPFRTKNDESVTITVPDEPAPIF